MKKIILFAALAVFLVGCNINPSKEERLQKLETEMQKATEKINELENRVELLERN